MLAFLLVVVTISAVTRSSAQLPIPSRELGYVYKDGQAGAQVKLTAYIDFTCPYSSLAFPTLLQVADLYLPDQVQLRVHAFSLPYHRNSHTISKAAYFLNTYNSPKNTTVFDWIQTVYDNIDSLSTGATLDQTDIQVLNFLAGLAYNLYGISSADFAAGVYNTDVDTSTRLDWKYGCTRGVYSTPSFTVNDVFVNAGSSWTVSQWTALIDGVLAS